MVKTLPAMQTDRTRVRSRGWKDALEKGTETQSSLLAWRIPWSENPSGPYSRWGRKDSNTTERLTLSLLLFRMML